MSNYIPDYAARPAPLRAILEKAYERSGKGTSRSVQGVRLSELSWGAVHAKAFEELQEQLRNAFKLAHRDQSQTLCVFTDASDEHWAAVVTQCESQCLGKPIEQQMHQPLGFLGAAFNETKQHWSTFEKEAYAVFQVFEKMDYMFACEEDIHLFTDHRNLLFVYNPVALRPTLCRHIVNKVQRWALYLSRFMYTIEHVDGKSNITADMMTRWYAGYRGKRRVARRVTGLLMAQDIVPSPQDEGCIWPSIEMVGNAQRTDPSESNGILRDDDGLLRKDGRIWIDSDSVELQFKLLVVAHCGSGGHRGSESSLSALKEEYTWDSIDSDVRAFVANCLHCIIAKAGNRIPRPISLTLHGKKPNEVVHFDLIYIGIGVDSLKYCSVIRDDLFSYLWICPSVAADAETAAKELSRWIRVFTAMEYWISDQGSHFKNKVMEAMSQEHKVKHHFTVAYSPWVNGTVEICMRHIRSACTALLSELKLGPQDWPLIIDVVMSALNEAPLRGLGKRPGGTFRTPLEVMTGIIPNLSRFSVSTHKGVEVSSLAHVRVKQLINIDELQKALNEMHKGVSERVHANRMKQIEHHNNKTNLVTPHFEVGDFVVVRRKQDKGHKLMFRWIGPRRVTRAISDMVYEVTGLIDEKAEIVHAACLMLYWANVDGELVSSKLLEQAEHIESKFEMADKLLDIGEADDGIFIQVQWLGQPDRTDWTWQPLLELYEDIPERVLEFLRKTRKKRIARKALAALGIQVN